MAVNTTTFESTLQTKLNDTTLAAKEMLLLGKALEATVGSIAVSDITTEGNNKVAAVNTAGTTQVTAVNNAGTTKVTAVNSAGTTKVNEINALATSTFKTVGGTSILGSGNIESLPAGGTVGQVVTNTGSGTGGWADAPSGELLQYKVYDLGDGDKTTTSYSPVLVATHTFTPQKATSKIIVTLSAQAYVDPGHNDQWMRIALTRNSTNPQSDALSDHMLARTVGERHGTSNHVHVQETWEQLVMSTSTAPITMRLYYWLEGAGGRVAWLHRGVYDRGQSTYYTIAEYEV